MKKQIMAALCCCLPAYLYAQTDTSQLAEVTVTGFQDVRVKQTSMHLESHSLKELETYSPFNLSDAMAKLPGISQMTTGNSISKPVIRGLYGNRVLVLLSGLRFDNQQFQDEHGLGLSQIGINRVEIIRGPASILYGTDAIGGVINIIEDKPMTLGRVMDIHTRYFSNTQGTLTDIGFSNRSSNQFWWRIRGGYENHADYADGDGHRVLNSRNKGYYVKAGFGFEKGRWEMNNSYNFSYNQYGFIINDLQSFFQPDGRNSRKMTGPHHNVLLNIFSSQNTFRLRSSVLKINAGVQSNRRAEDEGGGEISLDMHLLSLLQNARWEKYLKGDKILLVLNQQFTYENNTNLGKRILIPDANMMEGNLSSFVRVVAGKVDIEGGLGYNYKQIEALKTRVINIGSVNTPDPSKRPFSVGRSSANAMLGFTYNPNDWLNIKLNTATGNRAANLAELASNGLHEGVYRVEIGNPELKMEQNFNTDLSVQMTRSNWTFSASAYNNSFKNYIYLAPTNENWSGFQVFRFRQADAHIYGGELTASVKPMAALELKEAFSVIEGRLNDVDTAAGKYLPFIPPYKSITALRFQPEGKRNLTGLYVQPELEYNFKQEQPALFETATPAYTLVHLHCGLTTTWGGHNYNWNLSVRNLLNNTYTDHLSRLKYYGLNNQGINFIVSLNTRLTK